MSPSSTNVSLRLSPRSNLLLYYSSVLMGSSVTKTWRVRNDGETEWPEGVVLTFSSGDLLAGSPQDLVRLAYAISSSYYSIV